jgi:hypothetical protein
MNKWVKEEENRLKPSWTPRIVLVTGGEHVSFILRRGTKRFEPDML